MSNMKNLIVLSSISIVLVGCDNPVETVSHLASGYIQESVLDSFSEGSLSDDVKNTYLKTIKKGVTDLEAMNDPNLAEVHKVIDKHLEDNDLSMYDYNTIMSVIHKHKVAINKRNSNHKNDVINFKNEL